MNGVGGKITPLIGESDFTHSIRNTIQQVSKNTAAVLLIGERGTGKRLIAQHIHYAFSTYENVQNYSKKDFYEINCKSFSTADVKMIFNGITRFVPANKKITLFINYINELSEELQDELIDTINKVRNIGINLKIISSSEENLEELISSGKFKTDLFYKINSVVLNTLPLRMRKEDILPIAEYYRDLFKVQSGFKFEQFSDEAHNEMCNQFWKGNIDELINSVQKAFLIGNPPVIKSADLGIVLKSVIKTDVSGYGLEDKSLKSAIDSFKKDYLTKILEENNWNQTKTAKILGIQRTYVIKLISELGIKK